MHAALQSSRLPSPFRRMAAALVVLAGVFSLLPAAALADAQTPLTSGADGSPASGRLVHDSLPDTIVRVEFRAWWHATTERANDLPDAHAAARHGMMQDVIIRSVAMPAAGRFLRNVSPETAPAGCRAAEAEMTAARAQHNTMLGQKFGLALHGLRIRAITLEQANEDGKTRFIPLTGPGCRRVEPRPADTRSLLQRILPPVNGCPAMLRGLCR